MSSLLGFLANVVDRVLIVYVPDGVRGSSRRRFVERLRALVLESRGFAVVLQGSALAAPDELKNELPDIVDYVADRVLLGADDRGGRHAVIGAFLTEIDSWCVTGAPNCLSITAGVYPQSVSGRVRLSCSIALSDDGPPVATIAELRPETDS